MTMRAIMRLVGLAVAFLASAACLIVLDDPGLDALGTVREFRRVLPFSSNGVLSIRNLDGDIDIRGWDRSELEIVVESERRSGRRGWLVGSPNGRPRFDVETEGNSLTVRTRWEGNDSDAYPVHYFVNVPRAVDLRDLSTQRGHILIADLFGKARVSVLDGDLKVENYSGSLDASVSRGRIQAEVLDVRQEDEIRLTIRSGDLTMLLQPEANVKIEAEASAGISGDWPAAGTGAGTARTASFTLGNGAAPVTLRASAGRIELRKIQ
jgi:hypothetical protein